MRNHRIKRVQLNEYLFRIVDTDGLVLYHQVSHSAEYTLKSLWVNHIFPQLHLQVKVLNMLNPEKGPRVTLSNHFKLYITTANIRNGFLYLVGWQWR